MASKYQLQRDLTRYEYLKNNLGTVVTELNSANDSIGKIKTTIDDNYSINDSGNKTGERAKKLYNNVSETSNYVKNTIIPAINKKMEEIRKEIERIEEEEEARRRASSIRFRY